MAVTLKRCWPYVFDSTIFSAAVSTIGMFVMYLKDNAKDRQALTELKAYLAEFGTPPSHFPRHLPRHPMFYQETIIPTPPLTLPFSLPPLSHESYEKLKEIGIFPGMKFEDKFYATIKEAMENHKKLKATIPSMKSQMKFYGIVKQAMEDYEVSVAMAEADARLESLVRMSREVLGEEH